LSYVATLARFRTVNRALIRCSKSADTVSTVAVLSLNAALPKKVDGSVSTGRPL
jgi:hypothetical protein